MTKPDEMSAADMIRKLSAMLAKLPPDANKALKDRIVKATGHRPWLPTPGPQLWAVECEADELFFWRLGWRLKNANADRLGAH
jgi:hypothetical protein